MGILGLKYALMILVFLALAGQVFGF